MNTTPEYDTIDLRQMFWFLLKKWKVLLAAVLVGALLGAGVTALQAEKTVDSFDMEKLDQDSIQQYVAYQKLYEDHLKYAQDSVLLHMDSNAVYSGEITYYLTAGYSTELAAMQFSAIPDEPDILEKLKAAAGLDCGEQAVRELVGIWYNKRSEPNVQLVSSDDLESLPRSAVVSVSAIASTRESCEAMLGVLRGRVEEMDAQCREAYENYRFEMISDQVSFGYSSTVANAQKEEADQRSAYVTQLKTLEKGLGADEKAYYSLVYEPDEKPQQRGMLSLLKYPVLLAMLFGLLAVVVYCVQFAMDGHIKTVSDVREAYGVHVLACLSSGGKPRRGIDGWLDRHSQKAEPPANSREYLLTALNTLPQKKLLLCGEAADGGIQELTGWLSGQNPALRACGLLQSDARAQQAAPECDGVVVFVHLWKTSRMELEREIEICRTRKLPLVGVVTVGKA